MKRSIYVLLSLVFLLAGCAQNKNVTKLTIASQTRDCSGVGKQKCMLVKKGNAADWEFFYDQIQGFNYEEGYEYVLNVEEQKVENPPADASSIRYRLVKEISKTQKISDDLPIQPAEQARYQWGGKVLDVEETTIGRGAAEGQFPVKVIRIEVAHSATDLFQAQDTIHAELIPNPTVEPVLGREYMFRATDVHPSHAKGVYMLNTNVIDLV